MKQILDFTVTENSLLGSCYSLLKLSPSGAPMPLCHAGQFAQVKVPDCREAYLRRPISICLADGGSLWLLVRAAGAGTQALTRLNAGDTLNLILPLGNGFTTDVPHDSTLLVGGGVGVAPLLQLGHELRQKGVKPQFLIGARSEGDTLLREHFERLGTVHIATEDGSAGERGLVTEHSVWRQQWRHIACCGPLSMMKAVAKIASERGIDCEVSLENRMACGIGACLCCVEDTADSGNVCVCTEGPVFNTNRLKW